MRQDGHSEEEIAAYRDTFTKFDVDGGGAIDAAELGKLIRVLGYVMRMRMKILFTKLLG